MSPEGKILLSFFSLEVQAKKTDLMFPKTLLPRPQNESKKFQKLSFDFSYCKLPELAGSFIIFKLLETRDKTKIRLLHNYSDYRTIFGSHTINCNN